MRSFLRLIVFAPILLLSISASFLSGQSTQSTILGTVKDATGAAIAGAEIVVTNIDQGLTSSYRTDDRGNYQALELIPGKYAVQVAKTGFQTRLVEDILLTARQQLRADVVLAIGSTQVEVQVNGDSEGAIETETASISSTLNAQGVSNLPVNYYGSGGTSPLNVLQAIPGVQSDTAAGKQSPTANGTVSSNFSVQGGQPFQTEVSVDGISIQSVRYNTPLADAFPSAESISEIRVDGVNNNAEFGQAGEITTITKSGTNQYHGAAFWHFQNSDLDAKTFDETVKPHKVGNDFGVSIGGPASIPHLYDARNKTFFFSTYEGFRFPKQSQILDLVPTQDMLNGNFGVEFPDTPVINPAGEAPCALATGNPLCGAYANNQITPINSSAKPFLGLFPTPNYPVDAPYTTIAQAESGAGYNYTANRPANYNSNQFDARVDRRFSPKMLGFARFTYKDISLLNPQDLNIASVTNSDKYRILASSLIYDFTPNLLNEFRFGFTQEENGLINAIDGAPYTNQAGFDPVASNLPVNTTTGTEIYFVSGLTSLAAGNLNQTTQSHLFDYNDNLTWTKGQHTAKFGADVRTVQSESTLGNAQLNTVEVFVFEPLWTNLLGTFPGDAYQFSDFLTGAPVETQYYSLVPKDNGRSTYYGFYGQDQWRVTPRLTLSYGLRYEYHPGYHDTTGTIGNFNPDVPTTGAVIYPDGNAGKLNSAFLSTFDACGYGPANTQYAACTPVLSNSQAGLPNSLRTAQRDRILPRVGLAWRPFDDDKTAVRAGFGVYNTTTLGSIFYSLTDTLQSATLTYQNGPSNPAPLYYPPAYMWPETSAGANTSSYGSADFSTALQTNWKDPYSMQWDLSLDHEFAGNIGARVSYIGMKTDDLIWDPNENDMSLSKTTPAKSRLLTDRPFPNWNTINDRLSGAQATYHSLQAEADRRLSHSLSFQTAYTWAKNLADNQGPASTSFAAENGGSSSYRYNREIDFGNVYGTRRHRFVSNGVYELPFGRGRTFGANMNRAEDAIVGGWQLSSVFVWQTGPFLTAYIPSDDADPSGTGSGVLYGHNQHPDRVPGQKIAPANRSRSQWLNQDAFACPATNFAYTSTSYAGHPCTVGVGSNPIGRFGNETVGDIVGPGTVNLSAGLNKNFEITDRVHLRAEGTFTNVLNHTNLNDPILDITNPSFGKITTPRGSDFGGGRTGQVSMKLEF